MKTWILARSAPWVLAIGVAASVRAFGDPIAVRVNGERVSFDTVAPQARNGRILVPLRGVLEQLGAHVDWDPATETVIASEGDTQIRLPIGSRFAWVDGQRIALDVPAMTILGTTMVPLRFVSEALGADVRWNEANATVFIDTAARTAVDGSYGRIGRAHRSPRGLRMPVVDSLTTNLNDGWLYAGDTVRVTMRATPGGKAWFRIRGVVGEVPMDEVSPGTYVGMWRAGNIADTQVPQQDILAFVTVGDRSTPEVHPGE